MRVNEAVTPEKQNLEVTPWTQRLSHNYPFGFYLAEKKNEVLFKPTHQCTLGRMLREKQSRRKKIIKFRGHAVTDKNIEQQEDIASNQCYA